MIQRLILLFALFALAVAAQYAGFTSGMKDLKKAMDAFSKLEKKTGPAAVEVGEDLGSAYEEMIPFWRQRNASDAVKWSQEGKTAAAMLASGAFGGDENKVNEAFKTISGTCKPCHEAHRERIADGNYRIK